MLLSTRIDIVAYRSEADVRSPVIDGHIDLPILAREFFGNDLSKFDLRKETVRVFFSNLSPRGCNLRSWLRCSIALGGERQGTKTDAQLGHIDIPRIRQGHLGGFFWSM
jgi:membrane dipeptidase